MQKEKMVKLEIFIPDDYVDTLRDALAEIKVGVIGNYDHCISILKVKGYWRPLEGSEPFNGEVGQVSEGTECKVEVNCPERLIPLAMETIRGLHPYDEALINIIPLLNADYE